MRDTFHAASDGAREMDLPARGTTADPLNLEASSMAEFPVSTIVRPEAGPVLPAPHEHVVNHRVIVDELLLSGGD